MSGLTALEVKNAKPGRHADGHGLYLLVRPSGSRSWVLRIQVDGKWQDLGIGPVAQLSLAQARTKASELRNKVKAGENVRAKEEPGSASIPTFERAARDCHEAIKGGWRTSVIAILGCRRSRTTSSLPLGNTRR
ncbi:Arm DNA-binding domain-containing protein [Stakelama sp. CBK3Z-3]|uniref:Arm DNA-binding domain-containing protein n=1 Tax=Stakelama flava TaxID=2860338 RepID=A0ABS6XMZ3_9SPHN|nr:Arm DNA-binding domain-containing protein [Stakelama flava]